MCFKEKIDSFLTFMLSNFLQQMLLVTQNLYLFCPWKYEKKLSSKKKDTIENFQRLAWPAKKVHLRQKWILTAVRSSFRISLVGIHLIRIQIRLHKNLDLIILVFYLVARCQEINATTYPECDRKDISIDNEKQLL